MGVGRLSRCTRAVIPPRDFFLEGIVLISEIIPYERNARDNKQSIPAIAESIKQFGFRGQIKLRSHDDPTIVAGHHRVEACKLLGWTEIPEENICWCDDLTDDEVKALRLADNRTGEGGKWNRSLLREEVRQLAKSGVDMSKYKFDFKSRQREYGAERLRTDDYYNLGIVNASHTGGKFDMPTLEPCDYVPEKLLPFNYAKSTPDPAYTLHFFKDDYQFERLWSKPEKYLPLIQSFDAVLTPDFSFYMDMPLPMQQWNEYRRRALGNYWQRNGVNVIPTLSWTDERSYGFCFDGLPKKATLATSTVGVKSSEDTLAIWNAGMAEAMKRLKPKRLLLYGGNAGFDFGACEVIEYDTTTKFGDD